MRKIAIAAALAAAGLVAAPSAVADPVTGGKTVFKPDPATFEGFAARGIGHDEADGSHHDAAAARGLVEVALGAASLRRAGEGGDIADEQRPAEREQEPDDEILAEEHGDQCAAPVRTQPTCGARMSPWHSTTSPWPPVTC